ncbi:hypothetical protein [Gemmiger formicilis]|uniref:hypothetical protein n=1 Tax=Gemmiger formicilis TaxID=745368 RepID=UPI003CCB457A
MKHPKGIWLRRVCSPIISRVIGFALASCSETSPPLRKACGGGASPKRAIAPTRRRSKKSLACLTRLGIVLISDGVYRCTCEKLDTAPLFESQPRPGHMTQSTVNGTAFTPPPRPQASAPGGPSGSDTLYKERVPSWKRSRPCRSRLLALTAQGAAGGSARSPWSISTFDLTRRDSPAACKTGLLNDSGMLAARKSPF